MAKAKTQEKEILSTTGESLGAISLNESVFGVEPNLHVMHLALRRQLNNARQGSACAKTRAEVAGGGRKPWKQKGTGRARQGSIRATQWVGGGVPFGVGNRDFSFKINKKERVLALKSALSLKVLEKALVVVDNFNMESTKTKDALKMLDALKLEDKVLFVTSDDAANLYLATRNLPNCLVIYAEEVNVYDLVNADVVVMDEVAVNKLEEVLK